MAKSSGIRQLKKRYHDSLCEKSAVLNDRWDAVMRQQFNSQSLTALRQFVHQLAGSTGMYGYHRLAELARELDSYLNDPAPGDRAWRRNVSTSVSKLREGLQAQDSVPQPTR